MRLLMRCGDGAHRFARLRGRYAGFQAPDHVEEEPTPIDLHRQQKRNFGRPRRPHLHLIHRKSRQALGHHADDGVRTAVERHDLPQYIGSRGKHALPIDVADDGHRRTARLVFLRVEVAAQAGGHAKRGEEVVRYLHAYHLFWRFAVGDGECSTNGHAYRTEDVLARADCLDARPRHPEIVDLLRGVY